MTIKLANSSAFRYMGIAVFLFIASFFISCEKEVKLNLGEGNTSVVIEGEIENGRPPFVVITKSFGFFAKVDLSTLQGNFVHDALVIISDGTDTDTLREYTLDSSGFQFSVYSIDTATLTNFIVGEFNKSYKLSVTYEGKTYEATTKIPSLVPVDSFYGGPLNEPRTFVTTPDDAVSLFINVKDPDTTGNYFRYFTKRGNEPYYPVDIASAEELGSNGEYLPNIQIGFGKPAALSDTVVEAYPRRGDSITLKWSAIDRNVHEFWKTYQFAVNVIGNPFASPTNLPTNFSNGALGVWAGYGSAYINIQEYR